MINVAVLRLIALSCVLTSFSISQTTSTAIKDPTAIAIAQKALLLMNGATPYQDSVASGTLTIHGNQDGSFAAKIESQGKTSYRIDVQRPTGSASYVISGNQGCISEPSKASRSASSDNIRFHRVDYIPGLSLLSEYQTASVSVQYGGVDSVNGQAADVVSLTISGPTIGTVDTQKLSQHLYYIDQKTGLVTKMQSTRVSEDTLAASVKAETYYADYRSVNGFLVPYSQKLFLDGKPASDLALTSVVLNSGIAVSDFTLPCGGSDAN